MTTPKKRFTAIKAIAESHFDGDDYVETGQVLLDLKTIIDICEKGIKEPVAGVGILWEDDEDNEQVEELAVGDVQVFDNCTLAWKRTVKEIVIRE